MCTFATPFGKYRLLRLPFGIFTASEVFQKAMSNIFDGLDSTRVYIDYIHMWGATQQDHDKRLRAALLAAKSAGLTLNREKCVFVTDEVKFLGDVISKEGIKPDERLVKCVVQMPPPTSKQGLQKLLGAVNYLGRFIPNLFEKTKNLRALLKCNCMFDWSNGHDKECTKLCGTLSTAPVLAIFDPSKQSKITAAASSLALGAALLQLHGEHWRPVA